MEHTHKGLRHIWFNTKSFFSSSLHVCKPLLTSPLFLIPLFLKVVLAYLFVSQVTVDALIPFIKHYAFSDGGNSYGYFYEQGVENAFPYPTLMLLLMGSIYKFFGIFFDSLAHNITHVDILLERIPLLIADIGILVVLLSWFKKKQTEVLWLYWCSPILIYISYINGQVDAVPIFLLFSFLYFLFKEYDFLAFIVLGLAISSKLGIVIVLPFVFLYLLKERVSNLASLGKMMIPIFVFLGINYTNLSNQAFITMVFKAKEGLKIFDLVLPYNQTLFIYVIPTTFCLLLASAFWFRKYSRDLFMVFLGFSFFTITLFIPPMQGWYYWIIPFAVYFYVQAHERERVLYYSVSVFYFMYFAVIQESDYFSVFAFSFPSFGSIPTLYQIGIENGVPMNVVVNISFTLLQVVLLLNIFWIYRKGIEQYTRYKMHYKPFLVGVAGDSGSGKTTLAELLSNVFASRHVAVIAGDDLHKWERGNEMWMKYTHLDPRANELHADIHSAYSIKQGDSIVRRHYDHTSGTFTLPQKHASKRLVIFEGLHTLFLEKMRKAFDLKIFISPEEQLQLHWKIIRDFKNRGYSKGEVLEQIRFRQNDKEQYVKVQEKYADVVVTLRNNFSLGENLGKEGTQLSLSLEITCSNDIGLQPLLDEITKYMEVDYRIKDEKQNIKFQGTLTKEQVEEISKASIPELDELSLEERVWHDSYNGILQLFIAFYMFESMRLSHYEL